MQEPRVTSMLNNIRMIRTSFETAELFLPGDSTREEMQSLIAEARNDLFRQLRESVETPAHRFALNPAGFKVFALKLAAEGYLRQELDDWLRFDLFCAVARAEEQPGTSGEIYRYEFQDLPPSLDLLSPHEIYLKFLADLLRCAGNTDFYADRVLFDRNIFQKFAALMYALFASSEGGNESSGGGEESPSPVPKHPIPPQRGAMEASALPSEPTPGTENSRTLVQG